MTVHVSENSRAQPLMEIQIRTTEMDMLAVGGTASHSLYKGGFTDPKEVSLCYKIQIQSLFANHFIIHIVP